MPINRTDRERRRRAFLHAVAAGRSVTEAADHAGIAWRTLYTWRDKSAAFDAAWKRAAERAKSALTDRLQAALIQRAVEGVDEPVYHDGHCIGFRKRYSDALLLAGLRELTPEPPPLPYTLRAPDADAPDKHKRVTVVIAPLEEDDDDEAPPKPAAPTRSAPPTLDASPVAIAPSAPEPDPNKPLCWAHLGRREEDETW